MTDRRVLAFPVTLLELVRLAGQAQLRGDTETARVLLKELSDRQLRLRYASMAQQDPDGEGW